MCSTILLPLLPGSLWPGVVIPVKVLSVAQIELFNHLTMRKQMISIKLLVLAILETI